MRSRYGYKLYIFAAIIAYSIVCFTLEFMSYHSFRVYTWDLGIFNQALSSTLKGRFFYYTSEPFYTSNGCFLGTHFGPILFLVLPFYAVYPRPENLLFMSTVIVALGAIPAYEIARWLLKSDKVATMLGVFYLLYLPLQGVTLSGFSLEAIAVSLFLFSMYYLIKGDFKKLSIVVLLGLATHEASAPIIAFIGLYGVNHYRNPRKRGFQASVIIIILSTAYFVFAQNMRVFLGWTQRPSLWHEWSMISAESPSELPFKILANPSGAWNSLTFSAGAKLSYVLTLLAPAVFLPLFGVQGLLPALPYLAISFFSSYGIYYSVDSHYGAFVVPFLYVALVHGVAWLQKGRVLQVSASKLAKVALLASTFALVLVLPPTYGIYGIAQEDNTHNAVVHEFLSKIPDTASVLTQNNIFPQVSNRANAYTIPSPAWAEEYRIIGKEMLHNLSLTEIDYVLVDLNSEPYSASGGELILYEFILRIDSYEIMVEKDGVMLFKLRE